MKKVLSSIFILVLVFVAVLTVAKNTIARVSIEKGVEVVTGLQLKMRNLNIGIIKTLIGIDDLRLYNPPGYQDKVMLDMPEIFVDYDLPAIIKGKIHLNEVRINLKEFVVVKNADGDLNLNALKPVQKEARAVKPVPAKKAPVKKGKAPQIQIDKLQLKISKAIYKDYSKGGKPEVKEFNVNIDQAYTNIDDPNKLVALIVTKTLMHTTIANLANFDLKALEGTLGDTLKGAGKIISETTETVAKTTQQAEEAVEKTAETLKGAAASLGGLFGSEEKTAQ